MTNPIQNKESCGRLIALALSGAWRKSRSEIPLSAEELATITPNVIKGGAGALLWWRIRNTSLAESEDGKQLQTLYRLDRLEARVHVHKTRIVLAHLQQAGIEPVMMKGWSLARFYPEPGLRHYSDLDLCVAPRQWRAAQKALRGLGPLGLYVDLHRGLGRHENLKWDKLFGRSETVDFDGVRVRVLGFEDHLRLICLHWLRHGGWSPLGLCDIAAVLEARPSTFDWEIALGPNQKRADWVACAIGLAHQLLGAEVDGTPVAARARNLPGWLVPAVMEQWETCLNPNYRDIALSEIRPLIGTPRRLLSEVAARWRHPIRATIEVGGRFNDWPRTPYEIAAVLLRSSELPRQIAMLIWRQFRRVPRKSHGSSFC